MFKQSLTNIIAIILVLTGLLIYLFPTQTITLFQTFSPLEATATQKYDETIIQISGITIGVFGIMIQILQLYVTLQIYKGK